MRSESFFRRKSPEELEQQLSATEEKLGTNLDIQNVKELPVDDLQKRFPERYKVYLQLLRAEKNSADLSPDDMESMREWIQALNNLDSYIEKHHSNKEERVLRDRQITVFEDIRTSLEEGHKEGYVKLPTGVGKTVLFSQITEALGLKTLITVPSKILVNQTGEKLEQFTDLEYGTYFQENKDISKDVTVITYQSLIRLMESEFVDFKQYGAIILDEAHKGLGEKTQNALKKLDCIKLGFTATPEYSEDRNVADMLEHEIHAMSVVEGVQEGLINRFKNIRVETEVDMSSVDITSTGSYQDNQLEKAVNVFGRNKAAVDLYKQGFNGELAIAYCSGVAHAEAVKELFLENGIKADIVHGEIPIEKREQILQDFSEGKTNVLCNARVLIEGFDEPKVSVALNLHPTLSKVDAEQRGGRALRLDRSNPEKWAYIIDFVDKNAKRPPVTFAEVAGSAEEDVAEEFLDDEIKLQRLRDSLGGSDRMPLENLENIDLSGIRVITDKEEIMSIAKQDMSERNQFYEKKVDWSYTALQKDVLSKNILSSGQYMKHASENNWPSHQTLKNLAEFPKNKDGSLDWDTFLGREKRKEWTYEILKTDVIAHGVVSSMQYENLQKQNQWPDKGTIVKLQGSEHTVEGRIDWDSFLNREKKKEWTLESLQADVRAKFIQSSHEYKKLVKKNQWWNDTRLTDHQDFPKNSDGSNDWDTFLGRERKPQWNYESLQQDVLSKNVITSSQYLDLAPTYNWPAIPTLRKISQFPKKKGDSFDWDIFLGREKKHEWTFDTLRQDVKANNIESSVDYIKLAASKKWWSANTLIKREQFPRKVDGAPDWAEFLGKEKKPEWTYETLRNDVLSKGISKASHYQLATSENKWWDKSKLMKQPQFPKNADGSPDWDVFFGKKANAAKA